MFDLTNQNSRGLRLATVILIAAMTQGIVIGIHESIHAVSCLMVGHEVVEYSALHVDCQPDDALSTSTKFVAGSAAVVNVILGTIIYFVLQSGLNLSHTWKWFLWLLMFSNWSNGFGYLIFSGVSGAGDYAAVIEGWEPAIVWQLGMLAIGGVLWFAAVWLSLRVLSQIFGGDDPTEIRNRFFGLSIPSYVGAVVIILCAGLLNMHGFFGLPSIAGIMAAAGTMSPLLWMPFWYAAPNFKKKQIEALTVGFDLRWFAAAAVVSLFYVLVLGTGFTFS